MNNDNLHNIRYDGSQEDMKLRFLIEHCLPSDIVTDEIKLRTHRKRIARYHRKVTVLLSAAASVTVMIGVMLTAVLTSEKSEKDVALVQRTEKKTVVASLVKVCVPIGQTKSIILPDGTKVIANSRTTLTYPSLFTGKTREIAITGEAFLDVTHNAARPFVVHGNGFNLKVLGTKFNVNTYDSSNSSVALLDGSVEVTTRSDETVRLSPDHLVRIRDGFVRELIHVNAADYVSWMDGVLNLKGQTMEQIVSTLEDYYGLSIICSPNISGKRLYGKLQLNDNWERTLTSISFLSDSHYVVSGNVVKIRK